MQTQWNTHPLNEFERRKRAVIKKDKLLREEQTPKQIDKGLKDTMDASDPVAKY